MVYAVCCWCLCRLFSPQSSNPKRALATGPPYGLPPVRLSALRVGAIPPVPGYRPLEWCFPFNSRPRATAALTDYVLRAPPVKDCARFASLRSLRALASAFGVLDRGECAQQCHEYRRCRTTMRFGQNICSPVPLIALPRRLPCPCMARRNRQGHAATPAVPRTTGLLVRHPYPLRAIVTCAPVPLIAPLYRLAHPCMARRNPAQAAPDRRLYLPRLAYSNDTRTPYAPLSLPIHGSAESSRCTR